MRPRPTRPVPHRLSRRRTETLFPSCMARSTRSTYRERWPRPEEVPRRSSLARRLQFQPLGQQHPQLRFQFLDALGQVLDGLTFRVGQLAVLEHAALAARARHFARNAYHRGIVGHRVDYHRARADLHVIAYANIAQDFGARPDHDVVAQRRVALALFIARAAQRYALVEQAVVADLRGLADHYAH